MLAKQVHPRKPQPATVDFRLGPIAALTGLRRVLLFRDDVHALEVLRVDGLLHHAVCFASSTSVASRACAAGEWPFGSAAATRTVQRRPARSWRRSAPRRRIPDAGVPRQRRSLCRSAARFGRVSRNGRTQRDADDLGGLDLPRQHAVGGSTEDGANPSHLPCPTEAMSGNSVPGATT